MKPWIPFLSGNIGDYYFLYALDGLLFLIVEDFLSIGFHIFALYNIFVGLKALNKLKTAEWVY